MDDKIALDKPTTSTRLAPKSKSGEHKVQSTAIAPKAKRSKAKVSDKPQAKKPRRNNKSARPCHFMRLPPELRLTIYEYHFRNTLENIAYKLKKRKRGDVLVRTVKDFTMIKKALSLLHTSHTLRVEALAPCIQVAKAFQESMRVELDGLGSKRRKTSFKLFDDFLICTYDGAVPSRRKNPRCEKLKEHCSDVQKIRRALQMVESNVSAKDGLDADKGRVELQ